MQQPTDGLLIIGPCGSGKTYLAAAMVKERIEASLEAGFVRCQDFYGEIREGYRKNASEKHLIESYVKVPLLVLDDLATGSMSEFERRYALELIDKRLNALRPTVITTNWSLERISEQFDDRVASRLSSFIRILPGRRDRRIHS
jgi:DNA replication protein DnaC